MQYIKINQVRPGMRLARPIYNKNGVLLYERDTRLTPQGISSIEKFGLWGLYILEPAEPVPPLSDEDVELERFLMADNSLSRIGIQLSLYMGLRLGEVCALKRRHISYREALLQVRFTMQRIQDLSENAAKKTKIIVTEPKSSSSIRDIPIPDFLMERLQILRDMPRDAYILTGSTNFFIEPRTLENILKKYLRECRMEHTNYHVLRHTFATRCIEEGFDAKSLSEILGHSNVNITLNRYVHSSLEQKRKNMEKLEPSCL